MVRTVVCGIFFPADEHFRMEKLAIGTGTDLVNWLQLVSSA
jgi:hypothetical protein